MTVIGIDALFDQGPNSGGSSKTSRAYCGYMFGDEEASPNTMKQVQEVYQTRNQLVHQGAKVQAESIVLPTRKLLREPLKRMLLEKEEDHA